MSAHLTSGPLAHRSVSAATIVETLYLTDSGRVAGTTLLAGTSLGASLDEFGEISDDGRILTVGLVEGAPLSSGEWVLWELLGGFSNTAMVVSPRSWLRLDETSRAVVVSAVRLFLQVVVS